MRKMMKTKNLQIVPKNQQWIHVNVPVMSLQRFSDFKILPEQKMTKFDIPSFGKKKPNMVFFAFFEKYITDFFCQSKIKNQIAIKIWAQTS